MEEKKLKKEWRDEVLKHFPHGEEGKLQLDPDNAAVLCKILIDKGYAVCITGGDIGNDVYLHWIYAGDTDNLSFSNYDNVVFTPADYLWDYPQAYYEDIEEEHYVGLTD